MKSVFATASSASSVIRILESMCADVFAMSWTSSRGWRGRGSADAHVESQHRADAEQRVRRIVSGVAHVGERNLIEGLRGVVADREHVGQQLCRMPHDR